MKILALIKFSVLLIAASIYASGQDRKVLLNVSVYGEERKTIKDLKRENFLLYENNKPVEISSFSSENDPISAGFLIDISQSMGDGVDLCREGILNFLEKSNPKNEYFVAAFGKRIDLVSDFKGVGETEKIISADPSFLKKPKSGETVLYEATKFGVEQLSKAKNRKKIIFVLWDDGDDYNSGNYKELEKLVKNSGVTVYPIGCSRRTQPLAIFNLDELAEISGGKFVHFDRFPRPNSNPKLNFPFYSPKEDFMLQFSELAEEIQNQYIIGFVPDIKDRDNKWRNLKIESSKEVKKQFRGISITHRKGYFPLSEVVTSN